MQKIKMSRGTAMTFEEGCNKFQYEFAQNVSSYRLFARCIMFSLVIVSPHIIYGDIKTRYNVFRKTEYDVFDERILQLKRLVL